MTKEKEGERIIKIILQRNTLTTYKNVILYYIGDSFYAKKH